MNRTIMVWMGVLLLSLGAIQPAAMATDDPLNVLLIMADDIGFECFSSYGSKVNYWWAGQRRESHNQKTGIWRGPT